jgi:hypothetical protein
VPREPWLGSLHKPLSKPPIGEIRKLYDIVADTFTVLDKRLLPGLGVKVKIVLGFKAQYKGTKGMYVGILVTVHNGEATGLDIAIKVHPGDSTTAQPRFRQIFSREAVGPTITITHDTETGTNAEAGGSAPADSCKFGDNITDHKTTRPAKRPSTSSGRQTSPFQILTIGHDSKPRQTPMTIKVSTIESQCFYPSIPTRRTTMG